MNRNSKFAIRKSRLNSSIRQALFLTLGASFLAIPAAYAQQANEQSDEERAEEGARPERISVVGSRIRSDGLDNATPIDIISTELATEMGLNTLGELLRTSTVAAGSDQLISAYSVGFVTAGGAGAESISMRGLGASRTLVLLNGRRAGPAGTRGQVSAFDMNALPISAIERVEILKDGASSLYGSDAVAGVINIITKGGDDASINISGSQPFEDGGETYRVNGTYGKAFSRGSFRIVGDYNVNTGLTRGDRDFFECDQRYLFNEFGNRADPIDPRTQDYHCNGTGYGIWATASGEYRQDENGENGEPFSGGRFNYDYTGHGFPGVAAGGDYGHPFITQAPDGFYWSGHDLETDAWGNANHRFERTQTMIPETEVASVYLQGDYELTNNISVYGELLYSRRDTDMRNTRQVFTQDLGNLNVNMLDGWAGDNVGVMSVAITDHYSNATTIDYSRGVIGAEGAIGYWNWDVSWQRSHNSGQYAQDIFMYDSMIMSQCAMHGAALNPSLVDACASYGVVDGVAVGQTVVGGRDFYDVDWFGADHINGDWTQGAKDFLYGHEVGKTIYKQDSVDAFITGDLFELPAGPVGSAFGVAYQTDEIVDTPGEQTLQGNSWGLSGAGITAGRSTTKAAYAELQIPVLRDLPFVESFDITTSARWTDVNTYGSGTTWKLAGNWNIDENWRVRASRGTSFRAPALFELFLDNQTGFGGQTSVDPCIDWVNSTNPWYRQNCQAAGIPESYTSAVGSSAEIISGGGQGQLQAETSVSEGVGIIFTSTDNRFAASVDYYNIEISNQVSNVGGSSVSTLCYGSENFSNEPFCDQITRRDGTDGDWGIEQIRGGYLNTSLQQVRGVDYTLTYRDSFDFGDIRVRWDHTHQIERTFQQFPISDPTLYIGRIGNPKHIGSVSTALTRNDWTYTWNMNYFDGTSNYHLYVDGNQTTLRGEDVSFRAETPSYFLHSFSLNRTFNENIDVTFGIANAFDKKPPMASPAASNVVGNVPLFASQLDYLGRRAFLNATYTF